MPTRHCAKRMTRRLGNEKKQAFFHNTRLKRHCEGRITEPVTSETWWKQSKTLKDCSDCSPFSVWREMPSPCCNRLAAFSATPSSGCSDAAPATPRLPRPPAPNIQITIFCLCMMSECVFFCVIFIFVFMFKCFW